MGRISKKQRYFFGVITMILCAIIAVLGILRMTSYKKQAEISTGSLSEPKIEPSQQDERTIAHDHISPTVDPKNDYQVPQNLTINSSNAILIHAGTGSVIFDKNSTEKIYPASMTKIMTAVVSLENLADPYETIALNENVFSVLHGVNASVAGFKSGEEVRAIDLLYGLLLPSGAECGVGLANHIASSESKFVDLMNSKARELGMNDTHFSNTPIAKAPSASAGLNLSYSSSISISGSN